MSLFLFLQGLVIGFSIAAPVGPIGILCMHRTLRYGRMTGFLTGMGAASADAVYGFLAVFGLTAVVGGLVKSGIWMQCLGGFFLLAWGMKIMLTRPGALGEPTGIIKPHTAWFTTFILTLTNPLTIISFAAIFAGLGLAGQERSLWHSMLIVVGVFTGSALWWVTLSSIVGLMRSRLGPSIMKWINRAAGLVIMGFGLMALVKGVIL